MKRISAVLVVTVALVFAAAGAQAATCQAGVKGGVAIQKLAGDDVDNVDNRTGFAGGAYFQADFSKSFGLRVEGLYYMKGASTDVDTLGVPLTGTLKLDYVEFPVLAVAHIPMSDTATLNVFGGPTFSFNTKAEVDVSSGGLSGSVDIGDQVNSFDFGLTFGAGVSFEVRSVVLGIDGRYGFGLSKVPDLSGSDVSEGDDVKNQGFAIMAAVGIPVGKQ